MLFSLGLALGALSSVAQGWKTISTTEWGALSRSMTGKVILPTDSDYASSYVLWSSTYDDVYPMALIKCETVEDVQMAYSLVLDHFEPEIDINEQIISVRCGAHSFIGGSTTSGIVIDVSGLQTLDITDDGTAIVAPGINLSTFTAWAEEHDVTLPHGDCASVTFGGFLQGGGLGLTSRTFGMGADWVKSFDMLLSSGELVTASSDNEYSDLFWATLGGGGANFGIITQYEMNLPTKTQESPGLYVELTWDLSQDNWHAVASGWQAFIRNEDYEDHFATYLRIQPKTYLTQDYYVGLHGFWTGEQTDGLLVIAELLSEIDITPATAKIDLNVHFEGWIESSSSSRVRYSTQCKSRWAFDEFGTEFFETLLSRVEDLKSYEPLDEVFENDDESYVYPTQFMFIAPADGAIQTQGTRDDISFPFRDAQYFFAMCGRWRDGYENSEATMRAWLKDTVEELEPHLSQYSFVSFPDPALEDWQHSYFRDNYETLQEIKAKYDPNYMFRYSQSIVPSTWPKEYEGNEQFQLKFQSASYNSGTEKRMSLYRQWEIAQSSVSSSSDESKFSSFSFSLSENGEYNSSLMKLLGAIFVLLVVGYAFYYMLFKRHRDGYKSLDNDYFEDENYMIHTKYDTAIAL